MSSSFDLVTQTLLSPHSLSTHQLDEVVGSMLGSQIDYADLYFQYAVSESWALEDGLVTRAAHDLTQGVGARAVSHDKTGFAYADNLDAKALQQAATAAKSIARSGGSSAVKTEALPVPHALYTPDNPLVSIQDADKVAALQWLNTYVREQDERIKEVNLSLSASHELVLVMASDGTLATDVRPLVRLNVSVIVLEGERRETGSAGGGGRFTLDRLTNQDWMTVIADKAINVALINLEAMPAPAGTMPVVFGSGWCGVVLHEAVGHGLEGDFNRKGTSAFSNRIGEQVASPLCTIVDEGNIDQRRGSLNIDDEGTPTGRTVLVENGILKQYMQDKLNARLMGLPATGNGRRESYAHVPMPRMTNTYMMAGEHQPEDIIKSVDEGIYVTEMRGGQVDITSGKFVFTASVAYKIEKGQCTYPVKGVNLIGDGPDVLTKISMVGNDLALDDGVGTCGKEGQSVPVGVGMPTLKVDELTVGGTET